VTALTINVAGSPITTATGFTFGSLNTSLASLTMNISDCDLTADNIEAVMGVITTF